MKRIRLLDDTDFRLLETLCKYPKISQVQLAKKMKLTQPAISLRLRKLKEKGLIRNPGLEIDPKSIGFKMMKVDVQTQEGPAIIEKFRRCPAVVNSYMTDGRNGLSMIIVGESNEFCNCMIAEHLEKHQDISSVRSEIIEESMRGFNTYMDASHKLDSPPCGDHPCPECQFYLENGGECVGCPMTKFYKGAAWK
ncbi:MAG: Lrp/AsnC family transcriptional regulator [Nitrososphaerales archaeon]